MTANNAAGSLTDQDRSDLEPKSDRPCIMERAVLSQDHLVLREYEELCERENAMKLINDLRSYIDLHAREGSDSYIFIAVFKGGGCTGEWDTEERTWHQLQLVHEIDSEEWNMEVDLDPDSGDFNFSLLGAPFHVVAMQPLSSRRARWSPWPTLVFSSNRHFHALVDAGTYELILDRIMAYGRNYYGSNDPMLLSCQLLNKS